MEPLEEISHTPNMQEKSHRTLQTQSVATQTQDEAAACL